MIIDGALTSRRVLDLREQAYFTCGIHREVSKLIAGALWYTPLLLDSLLASSLRLLRLVIVDR